MSAVADIDYKSLYEQSQLRIIALEQQLAQLQKMIFGSRHERFVPNNNPAQLSLGITSDAVATCSVTDAKKISYTRTNVTVEEKTAGTSGSYEAAGASSSRSHPR